MIKFKPIPDSENTQAVVIDGVHAATARSYSPNVWVLLTLPDTTVAGKFRTDETPLFFATSFPQLKAKLFHADERGDFAQIINDPQLSVV